MLKIYPDYDIRFIGYNNWLVGSHTFTKKEAKTYPEYKYKKQRILLHNTESYNRLVRLLVNSHANSSDRVKTHVNGNYNEFLVANSGITFGATPTSYGFYFGKLFKGKPLPVQAEHFFKKDNSQYIGIVKDNKRFGKGYNNEYSNGSVLVRRTIGTWEDGKLSGYAEQDNYLLHQHFEGFFSNGHKNGWGILTDTSNNICYEGIWKNNYLNGTVEVRDLQGNNFFNGKYKNNEKNGFGIEQCENGSVFKGNWKNGLKHGKGVLKESDSEEIYKETWKKGELKKRKKI